MSDSFDGFPQPVAEKSDIRVAKVVEFRRQRHHAPHVPEVLPPADDWNVAELSRSNAELQEFAMTVAHDLKEPLRMIAIFTQLLTRKANLGEPETEIAQHIVAGVSRMSSLLDHLLSSATYGFSESPCSVDLEDAAAQATRNLTGAIAANAATVSIGSLPTVLGNAHDMIRLFQNLIGNALKYRSEAAVIVQITAEEYGQDWVLRVRDNGIGIAGEHHRLIFGHSTRLRPEETAGNGIGLAICKKIVEGFGGKIWVESQPGKGSTFCFTIAACRHAGESLGLNL